MAAYSKVVLTGREIAPRQGLLVQDCSVAVIWAFDTPHLADFDGVVTAVNEVCVKMLEGWLPVLLVEPGAMRANECKRVRTGEAVLWVPIAFSSNLQMRKRSSVRS